MDNDKKIFMQAISEGYRADRGSTLQDPVTLYDLIHSGSIPAIYQLSQDLFTALEFVYSESRWIADISEQTIVYSDLGRFSVMVAGNTLPRSILPDTARFASNEYWMPVFAYLVGRVRLTELDPGEVPGILFNYLQVVFLVLRARLSLIDQEGDYDSTAMMEQLPIILDRLVPEYRALFTRLLTRGNKTPRPSDLEQMKALFIKKIVLQTNEPAAIVEEASPVLPVICRFECASQDLHRGDIVEFSWEVDDAESVVLFRDGLAFKKIEQGKNCIRLAEEFDDRAVVSYSLYACNNHGYVSSQLLLKRGRRRPVMRPPLPLPVALMLAVALTLSVWLWSGQ